MKIVKYTINRVAKVDGFYVDIYVGNKRITTKVAKDIQDLYILINSLESQFKTIGLVKRGA